MAENHTRENEERFGEEGLVLLLGDLDQITEVPGLSVHLLSANSHPSTDNSTLQLRWQYVIR